MARPFLGLFAIAVLAGPALAQGDAPDQSWRDRSRWDWGQHRTGFAGEAQERPVAPARIWDHWDDPGAPVRFAGQPRRG